MKKAADSGSALAFRVGGGNFPGVRLHGGAMVQVSGARLVPSSLRVGLRVMCLVSWKKSTLAHPVTFPPLSLPFIFVSGTFGAVQVGSQVLVASRNAAQAAGVFGQ